MPRWLGICITAASTAIVILCALVPATHAAFPGQNGRISFSSLASGSGDLFALPADGSSGWQRLTSDPADDAQSGWSPDGRQIAFRSRRDGNYEVYLMNADGTGQRRLTATPAPMFSTQPSWSPDGGQLLFRSSRSGNPELWLMRSDGANARQLTSHPGDERYPGFSPDGSKIAFISDRDGDFDLYLMDPNGADIRQLTHNSVLDTGPAWSPDGTEIAFASERDGNREIYMMNADGSGPRRLTVNGAEDTGPAFAPDGTQIAFTSMRDGNGEIYVMGRDGSGQRRLTSAPTLEQSPDWQPLPHGPNGRQPEQPAAGARPDRRAPRLVIRLRRRQRAMRNGVVVVRARCDEPCTVTARGWIARDAGRNPLKLNRARRTLRTGVQVRLKLRLPKGARTFLRRALRRRRGIYARIEIAARDPAGNTRTVVRRVKLTR